MTAADVGSIGRRRLRTALRTERERAELTQEEVAKEMDWSLSKIIRIERGTVGISTNDVKALLGLYRVTDRDRVDDIVGLARSSRAKPWWSGFRHKFPDGLLKYVGLEPDASSLKFFQPSVIPGVLQTERYARAAVIATAPVGASAEYIEENIDFRRQRQRALFDQSRPPELTVVLDEAVLRRGAGDTEVMLEQLEHLLSTIARSTVTIRIVPFAVGIHTGVYGPFIILDFADEHDRPALYIENNYEAQVLRDKPELIEQYRSYFDSLLSDALSAAESIALIRQLADGLRTAAGSALR